MGGNTLVTSKAGDTHCPMPLKPKGWSPITMATHAVLTPPSGPLPRLPSILIITLPVLPKDSARDKTNYSIT